MRDIFRNAQNADSVWTLCWVSQFWSSSVCWLISALAIITLSALSNLWTVQCWDDEAVWEVSELKKTNLYNKSVLCSQIKKRRQIWNIIIKRLSFAFLILWIESLLQSIQQSIALQMNLFQIWASSSEITFSRELSNSVNQNLSAEVEHLVLSSLCRAMTVFETLNERISLNTHSSLLSCLKHCCQSLRHEVAEQQQWDLCSSRIYCISHWC